MLQRLIELWDKNIAENAVVSDVILRSEQSLLEDEETREVTLIITPLGADQPVASVFLYEVEAGQTYEVEIEVEYADAQVNDSILGLWEKARKLVAEISLQEKKRFIAEGQLVESSVVLDYHFLLKSRDQQEETLQEWEQIVNRAASDLKKILQLS
ncbi:hypothetical protein NDK47_08445 [Brevibacillus ruminantium]|uniref:DUF4268 domain-containing protein n=1 Tax=Brevibacillus ruminantium TaxID=2950604 RepID=A0ABY4WKU4_9BACL|nr:hypothetical protein [Brevibacillus ruminantium]USG67289.1 hypothetical protein NDK47_08445 [Brevibacillus ruminantium]